jgi:hypothetical protein
MKIAIHSFLNDLRFRSKSFRLYWILLLLVLSLAMPAVFFRGTLPQSTATEMDIPQPVSLQGISLGPIIWREGFNNRSLWKVSGPSSPVPPNLQVNKTLSLIISIPSRTTAQAWTVYHNLSISLDSNPIFVLRLQLSPGVSYGVRFWGVTASNKPFTAWQEGSTLQHRPGIGSPETIVASLSTESSTPNPTLSLVGARITLMAIYVEAVPLVSGTFSMYVYDIHTGSAHITRSNSNQINGNFTALVADLGPTVATQSLYQVFAGLDIKGSSDLTYVPYFTVGARVVAQGFTYVTKIATTYELALMSPLNVNSSPLFTGDLRSSSLVISARIGEISFFELHSVSVRFFTTRNAQTASLDLTTSRNLVFYFFVFLFVIPIAMVVLIVRVFKDEN